MAWICLLAIFVSFSIVLGGRLFGTFIVDPFLLYFLGYLVTKFIYKNVAPRLKNSALRRAFPLLFVISIISLWIGGILPYFNVVTSCDVYFGLLPQDFIGPENGNSFMWNGLGINKVFGKNIVPDNLIPTYRYFWFNVLAILVWLSYPVIQFLGVMRGNAEALISKPTFWRSLGSLAKAFLIGLFFSLTIAAFTSLIVMLYS